MTDGEREAIRRYLVEPMRALYNHMLNVEAMAVNAAVYEQLEESRQTVRDAFAKMDVQFAPVGRGE